MNHVNINQLWHLADTLTVHQAAALIAGIDPNDVQFNSYGVAWTQDENGFSASQSWVNTTFAALTNAITARKLPAKIIFDARPVTKGDEQTLIDMLEFGDLERDFTSYPSMEMLADGDERLAGMYFVKDKPNWEKSLVDRADLIAWLSRNGQSSGFFFPESESGPDYIDPNNPRYAPKLAAAVRAWQAVTDPKGRSPKKALDKWLREHAATFGLTDEEGNPVNQAIEECSKVANWQPGGGASKTPGG